MFTTMAPPRSSNLASTPATPVIPTPAPVLTQSPNVHKPTPTAAKLSPQQPSESSVTRIPEILPHTRVFPIQIGTELFKLSGLSLSSDAPSYFSQSFRCQIEQARAKGDDDPPPRTLYIDRDPGTFRDIALHLQGYHVRPRDGTHFVRLFADAQFYNREFILVSLSICYQLVLLTQNSSVPKLVSQLQEEPIFVNVGGREFELSRSLFVDSGNSPNYFTLGFSFFHPSAATLFPGLDRDTLVRPPSIQPPTVAHRSADVFAELILLLRGDTVEIRSLEHRQSLLRECRYYLFKGLEQKLLPHRKCYNQPRHRFEITLRVEDILKSGISVIPDPTAPTMTTATSASSFMTPSPAASHGFGSHGSHDETMGLASWVHYARPYVDAHPAELVLETGRDAARLHASPAGETRVEFFHDTRVRIARMLEVIATKLSLPSTSQPLGLLMTSGGAESQPPSPGLTSLCDQDHVRVSIDENTAIELDGRPHSWTAPFWNDDTGGLHADYEEHNSPLRKRRRTTGGITLSTLDTSLATVSTRAEGYEWIIKNALWRMRIRASPSVRRPAECVLVAVKLEAYSCEAARNASCSFLGTGM